MHKSACFCSSSGRWPVCFAAVVRALATLAVAAALAVLGVAPVAAGAAAAPLAAGIALPAVASSPRGATAASPSTMPPPVTAGGSASAAAATAAQPRSQPQSRSQPLVVTDDEGHVLKLPGPAQRIVSLSAGATALLFAAGAGGRIVGTVAYSSEPAAASRIRRVGDAQTFDVEDILSLHPDVVIAWSSGTPETRIQMLERVGLPVYRQRVTRLDDLAASIRHFGVLAGTRVTADAAARALQRRIDRIRAGNAHDAAATARQVFVEIWNRPLYTVGRNQLVTDALAACGYRNLFDDLAAAAPAVGLESVLARNPDVILALPDEPRAGAQWLADWRPYGSLKAVRSGRLVSFSDARLTRLGPGAVDALASLCRALDAAGRGPA